MGKVGYLGPSLSSLQGKHCWCVRSDVGTEARFPLMGACSSSSAGSDAVGFANIEARLKATNVRLVTICNSHYCEAARWSLQLAGIATAECTYSVPSPLREDAVSNVRNVELETPEGQENREARGLRGSMAVGEFEGMPATDEGVIKRRTGASSTHARYEIRGATRHLARTMLGGPPQLPAGAALGRGPTARRAPVCEQVAWMWSYRARESRPVQYRIR